MFTALVDLQQRRRLRVIFDAWQVHDQRVGAVAFDDRFDRRLEPEVGTLEACEVGERVPDRDPRQSPETDADDREVVDERPELSALIVDRDHAAALEPGFQL